MIIESSKAYHANSAVSHSKLEVFRKRPQMYYKRFLAKTIEDREPSSSFVIGSAVHACVLEPDVFKKEYVQSMKFDRRTKEGKIAAAEFEAKLGDRIALDPDEFQLVEDISGHVMANPLAKELLSDGYPERVWRKHGQLDLQCRTDWFNPKGVELSGGKPYVVDLKTIDSLDDGSVRAFERSVYQWGYHRQAGFYLPLISELWVNPVFTMYFIVVEKCEPYGVAVYKLSDDAVACGQDETILDLKRLMKCLNTKDWPNIEPVVSEIGLPPWYRK